MQTANLVPLDRPSLEAVVREHEAAIFRRALSLSGHKSDAWDLVQDTFERALRTLSSDYPRDKVRAWLLLTLRNLFIDRQRASRRRRHLPLLDDLAAPELNVDGEEIHWRRVEDEALARCLGQLDTRLREVYVLRVAEDLPLATIGARLGIPLATAGTRLYRARARLRALLTAEIGSSRAPANVA
jgi:RNA polymerase sigma-70 factor, ECF subfamily